MAKNWSCFQVNPRLDYQAYPVTPPKAELTEASHSLRRKMLTQPPGTTARRAIWMVHGMGQQIPFETLEQLTDGVLRAAEAKNIPASEPSFREVRVGETLLQRVELTFNPGSAGAREVHLYECYWAPRTEGAVKLRDVIGFLWDGGTRGLVNYFSGFQRALFGRMATFKLHLRTPFFLLLVLALLAALMAINAMVLATGASLAGISEMPTGLPMQPITAVAAVVIAVVITFGVVLFLAETSRPTSGSGAAWGRTICYLTWAGVFFAAASLLFGALLMAVMFWRAWVPACLTAIAQHRLLVVANLSSLTAIALLGISRMWRRRQISKTERPEVGILPQLVFYAAFLLHLAVIAGTLLFTSRAGMGQWAGDFTSLANRMFQNIHSLAAAIVGERIANWMPWVLSSQAWVWPFLALISAGLRNIIVEYVGDVTAYVASNRLDRFDDLRTAIKALAKVSATAVYSAKALENDNFEYEKVAVVGHSLGSVIAYDTLNRLIADDALSSQAAGIVRRTCLLLTFGSPLDKTAFFFSMMAKRTRHIREQLAAVVQPLIEDRDCRQKIPWRNVYSRNDIISGSLDFYQFPDPHPGVEQVREVINEKDNAALVPLVAHVEYWSNLTVWNRLLEAVLDLPAA